MKNCFKKVLVFLLILTLAIPAVNGVEAKAASKPSLSTKEMTIGIGSYSSKEGYFYHKTKTRYTLLVEDSNKKATYTFKSSNKKVATVKTKGTKGYITGVKAGKATITVNQKLNGKITLVGKCKITVKEATAYISEYTMLMSEERELTTGTNTERFCEIFNFNPEAKYTYECEDSNFTMIDVRKDEGGGYYSLYQQYTAKKAGTYSVTVKETYKNITREIGTFEITIVPAVDPEINLYIGDQTHLSWYIHGVSLIMPLYEIENDGILTDLGDGFIKAEKEGTTTIDVWRYDSENETKGEFMGTITVIVTEE